jgi:Tol biopolymer transport system component
VAAVLAAALGFVGLQWSSLANRPEPLVRATILPPEGHDWYLEGTRPGRVAISPDGRQLAFVALGEGDAAPLLWVRPLDSPVARPLPGTEGAGYPFWSPDGRHVAFFAGGKLKKIAVAGGPPVVLCDASNGKSGSWNRQGDIVFTPTHVAPIYRVAAAGGEPVALTELDSEAGDDSHRHPVFLPDGRQFLYVARRSGANREAMLRIGSLDGTTDRDLIATPANAAYAAGRLLFMRADTLMAQPFDPGSLELSGEAVPLVERVLQIPRGALSGFAVSETGTLVYHTGELKQSSQLVWKDRRGFDLGTLGEPAEQSGVSLSADGKRAGLRLVGEDGQSDLWIYDTDRGLRSRFTFDPGDDGAAAWSPDGRQIAFASDRSGGFFSLYLKDVGGTGDAELLLAEEQTQFPSGWTPDGKMVVYTQFSSETRSDLMAVPIDGDREPIPLLVTKFAERSPRVSPDGRWLAYWSDESGRDEVYVTTFPVPARKWQVSVEGGQRPRWTRNGTEIVYLQDESLIAVAVSSAGDTFEVGAATKLFDVEIGGNTHWDVTADGERFLINPAPERGPSASALQLAVNWPAMLEDR